MSGYEQALLSMMLQNFFIKLMRLQGGILK